MPVSADKVIGANGEQVKPVDGVTVAARVTVPVKPLRAFTDMVEAPVTPTLTGTTDGLGGEKLKSTMWKSIAFELWESVPMAAEPARVTT